MYNFISDNMKNKIGYMIFVIISVSILFILLISLNVREYKTNKKDNNYETTEIITTNNVDKVQDKEVNINGENITMKLNLYKSYDGYSLYYDSSRFKVVKYTSGNIRITSINDSNSYLEITKLNKDTYQDSYNYMKSHEDEYKYEFLENKDVYLQVLLHDNTDSTTSKIINYMLSTLVIN